MAQSTGTVLRYRYDVGTSSTVGAVVTDREGDQLVKSGGKLSYDDLDQLTRQEAEQYTPKQALDF